MFSDRIARLRKEKAMKQSDLAEKLGVSVDSVRRWEQGKRSPDIEILNKLAEVLSTTVSYISGETDNPARNIDSLESEIKEKLSVIKRGDLIGEGKILFYAGGDGKQFIIPATEENQAWFRELMEKSIMNRATVPAAPAV
ncbi:MAG: helix-turn-helix transcriptional regulator [Synergistaceae bacterium]|nr:helix-turn-helix transcriptional regulator [Synergistaceae bacterium]